MVLTDTCIFSITCIC